MCAFGPPRPGLPQAQCVLLLTASRKAASSVWPMLVAQCCRTAQHSTAAQTHRQHCRTHRSEIHASFKRLLSVTDMAHTVLSTLHQQDAQKHIDDAESAADSPGVTLQHRQHGG